MPSFEKHPHNSVSRIHLSSIVLSSVHNILPRSSTRIRLPLRNTVTLKYVPSAFTVEVFRYMLIRPHLGNSLPSELAFPSASQLCRWRRNFPESLFAISVSQYSSEGFRRLVQLQIILWRRDEDELLLRGDRVPGSVCGFKTGSENPCDGLTSTCSKRGALDGATA